MKHLILATAGHVDHGKTALIKALTGTDTDRLPEEKARGITIELGFAQLQLGEVSLGVIDVPGHEDFVRNMIAGIGSIDLALLVVAADDGWMPQTEEHLQILDYTGVARLVVAVNKSDLAPMPDIRAKLAGTRFADAAIVATSVPRVSGIDELSACLARTCAELPSPPDFGKPRLFVDRVFTARGSGTIVTGTLTGGGFARGQTVKLQPSGLTSRVRTVQSHNEALELAKPGMRTALNLADLTTEQITRGTIVTAAGSGDPSTTIDVQLTRSVRLPVTARKLRSGAMVHVHYGSARALARVTLLEAAELRPGETALARLRFDEPIFVFAGDRFIVRDSSEQQTLAGGVVLDPDADGIRFGSAEQRKFLAARAAAPYDCEVLRESLLRRDRYVLGEQLLRKSRCTMASPNGFVADPNWWRELKQQASATIDEHHRQQPHEGGLDLVQLRARLAIPAQLSDALIAELCASGFTRQQNAIARANHRRSLPAQLRVAGERIRSVLAQRSLDPPARKELAPDATAQQALRFLIESGEVILLSSDIALSTAAFAQLKTAIVEYLRGHGSGTASELRQAAGSTRRIMIPLLERLDRDGVTRREGDRRTLR